MYSDYSDSETESVASEAGSTVGCNTGHGKTGRDRRKSSKPTSTPQQSAVKDFILQKGGTVSFSELRRQSFYPDDEDVDEWLRKEPGRYIVNRDLKARVQSVSVIVKVRLCYDFAHSRCKFGQGCTNVHICTDFLKGHCSSEACKFPHDFQNKQAKKVVKSMGLEGLPDDKIRQVIRGSLPNVCTFYNSPNGCKDNTLCTKLHMCKEYVTETCSGDCARSHSFSEPHNENVLQKHLMSCRMPENILMHSTMLSGDSGGKRSHGAVPVSRGRGRSHGRGGGNQAKSTENLLHGATSTSSLHQSTESLESAGRRESHKHSRGRGRGGRGGRGHGRGRGGGSLAKSSENLSLSSTDGVKSLGNTGRKEPHQQLEHSGGWERGGGRRGGRGGRGRGRSGQGIKSGTTLSPATEMATPVPAPPEGEIFIRLCCQDDGRQKLESLWNLEFSEFGLDLNQTKSWIRQHPNKFRLYENMDGELEVSVINTKARLCFSHNTKMACHKGEQCPFFHLCRHFLQGSCKFGSRCKSLHNLQSEQARKVVQELKLESLTDEQIVNVIRNSTPKVCQSYNSGSCLKADRCLDIHICSEFVRGSCTDDSCDLDHETCFDTSQTRKILTQYRMANTDQQVVIKTLLIPPTRKTATAVATVTTMMTPSSAPRVQLSTSSVPTTPPSVQPVTTSTSSAVPRAQPSTNTTPTTVAKVQQATTSMATLASRTEAAIDLALARNVENIAANVLATMTLTAESLAQKTISVISSTAPRVQPTTTLTSTTAPRVQPTASRVQPTARRVQPPATSTPTERVTTAVGAPSESDMFVLMCSKHDGKPLPVDYLWHVYLCPHYLDLNQVISWFRQCSNKFRVYENMNGELEVSVMVPKARLCFSHNTKMGCHKGDQCPFFHLCRNLIQGSCHHGSNCKFSHCLQSEQARKVVQELQLDSLTDEQIVNVIRNSTPKVCQSYNSCSCLKADRCLDIHVCSEFVKGCCDSSCGLNHEGCFDTLQTRKILTQYCMANTDQRAVIKTLLVPPSTTRRQSTTAPKLRVQPTVPPAVQVVKHKAKASDQNEERILDHDTTICEQFLAGRCLKSRLCGHHHIKTPYLWQYKDLQSVSASQGEEWVSFSSEVTSKMEEAFCQPSNVIFNLSHIETRLNGWTVHFDTMKLVISDTFPSKRLQIRRLSTPSSVESNSGVMSTKWLWYWEDKGSWCKYGEIPQSGRSTSITSDDIERAYLSKQPTYKFRTNEYPYTLHFTEMYQENLDPRYSTRRNVRRRPAFVQLQSPGARTSQASSVTAGSLPPTWKPMPAKEAFIQVPLAPSDPEFKEVETLFRQTMRDNMIILHIDRVQNPHLWEKYCINKQQMVQKSMESRYGGGRGTRTHIDERKLFHGTEPEIIKGICHQNFDFRLSGKNATLYGKGSYFAKQASYSHRYSRASSDGIRYMFLANVLVGRYTTGKQNIPRPPPIDPSDPYGDLYDSCVDNEANPSIFVVFKDDQCYPAYLIKYAEQDDLISADAFDTGVGYPFYSSYKSHTPPTPSTSSHPYSSHGVRGSTQPLSSTSSPTRQPVSTPYLPSGIPSRVQSVPASNPSPHTGQPRSASYQPYRANVGVPTNSGSASNVQQPRSPDKKQGCSIQ